MAGQMCWLSRHGNDGEKILHLQTQTSSSWQPYTVFRHLAVPDYRVPGGSKGWATYQKLLKASWTLVPSARAKEFAPM